MTEKKNRQAVNRVEDAVLTLNWFFREQSESDQGIDAQVEKFIVAHRDDGVGTSRGVVGIEVRRGGVK